MVRWQAGAQTLTHTWTLPPDQQIVKVWSALKSQNNLYGVWIHFRSVENTDLGRNQTAFNFHSPRFLPELWTTILLAKQQVFFCRSLGTYLLVIEASHVRWALWVQIWLSWARHPDSATCAGLEHGHDYSFCIASELKCLKRLVHGFSLICWKPPRLP